MKRVIGLVWAVVAMLTAPDAASVRTVAEGSSLAAVLAEASPGDTVRLSAGRHDGPLVIAVPLVLEGDPGARVVGPDTGTVITVLADSCLITSLYVTGSGANLLRDDAGIKVFGNGVRIVGNRLERNLHGIYVQGGDGVVITGNTILGRPDLIQSDRGNGIHLWSADGCTVRGNTIRDTRDGIYVSFSSHDHFRYNTVSRVRYGLHYMYSDSNRFDHNTFEYNVAGAALMYSEGLTVEENVFRHNRRYWAHGILLQACDNSVFRANTLEDNTDGLFVSNANNNRFVGNVLSGNDVAVNLFSSSSGNIFSGNAFDMNLTAFSLEGNVGKSGNRWSEEGRGNYWSDYRGFDLDGDGIGDTPHPATTLFEYIESEIPLIRLYLKSPAAAALEAADRALPVIDVPAVKDPAPLVRPPEKLLAFTTSRPSGGTWLAAGASLFVLMGCIATRMVVRRR